LATVSRFCSSVVALPEPHAAEYAGAVAAEVAAHRHLTTLAASDAALVAYAAPGAHLTDKSVVSRRAAAAGLPTLPEVVVSEVTALPEACRDLTWPLIAKPLVRQAGDPPAQEVRSAAELRPLLLGRPVLLQVRHDGELTAVSGVVHDGKIRAAVAQRSLRLWPVRAGTTCWGVSVEPDPSRLEALAQIVADHEGVFQAQFVGPYLVDVNPRVYGSLPLAVAAGVNLPSIYCALLQDEAVPWTVGRSGVTYRWVEGDVRHALAARRRHAASWGDVARQLRPRAGTAHSVVLWSDPRPMVLRARFGLRELLPW
jgi:predicted ATP-grasp superfamily ATP-dependent carboligase